MPHKVNWYVENRVLRLQLWGDGSEQDFLQSSEELVEIIRQQTNPVILMLDFCEAGKINFSLSPLKTLAQFRVQQLPLERLVVISNNALYGFFSMMIGKITELPVAVFKTQEEADVLIARHLAITTVPKVVEENR